MEFWESVKATNDIFDASGKKVCEIDFVPSTRRILTIRTMPYENEAAVADNANEIICCTDDQGLITSERLTRAVAQKEGKRYLVVTTLLFHNGKMLLQKRAADKRLDPDKLSASAHGVAKDIQGIQGMRILNTELVALINSALEINEELRHGKDQTPFVIRMWDGTEIELVEYSSHMKWDDQNVIYLVPSTIVPDGGYPLEDPLNKRTRTICNAFIFSKEEPPISIDPSEAQGHEWVQISRSGDRTDTTVDVQQTADESFNTAIARAVEADAAAVGRALLRNLFR